jgi:hypothetical protein
MWKLIVIAEAPPLRVVPVVKTCLMSSTIESFAAIEIASDKRTLSSDRVNVPALAAVLVTTMLVTTAVVADGTVYKVVLVVVVAAPLKSVFGVFGI